MIPYCDAIFVGHAFSRGSRRWWRSGDFVLELSRWRWVRVGLCDEMAWNICWSKLRFVQCWATQPEQFWSWESELRWSKRKLRVVQHFQSAWIHDAKVIFHKSSASVTITRNFWPHSRYAGLRAPATTYAAVISRDTITFPWYVRVTELENAPKNLALCVCHMCHVSYPHCAFSNSSCGSFCFAQL